MHHMFGLLIPLAPFLLAGFAIWTNHQRKIAQMQLRNADDPAMARLREVNAELEERVAVLERIVTDRRYSLAHEIEALRLPAEDRKLTS